MSADTRLAEPALHCRRVVVAVPPAGFGEQLAIMRAWLDAACGSSGWQSAPGGPAGSTEATIAFLFADPDCARAFVLRFGCGYRTHLRRTV